MVIGLFYGNWSYFVGNWSYFVGSWSYFNGTHSYCTVVDGLFYDNWSCFDDKWYYFDVSWSAFYGFWSYFDRSWHVNTCFIVDAGTILLVVWNHVTSSSSLTKLVRYPFFLSFSVFFAQSLTSSKFTNNSYTETSQSHNADTVPCRRRPGSNVWGVNLYLSGQRAEALPNELSRLPRRFWYPESSVLCTDVCRGWFGLL